METNSIGSAFTKTQRLIIGSILLLLVDLFWVSSSELTKFIYVNETFQKPFFCTYVKTSMFSLYLLGFLFWPPWRENYSRQPPSNYTFLEDETEDEIFTNVEGGTEMSRSLSNPIFVPVKTLEVFENSGTESDDSSIKSVRFNKLAEVRQMSEAEAAEALLARLSYHASLRASEIAQRAASKLSIAQVARISFMFCFLWFLGNYMYQLALSKTEAGVVNVLSSTSSLFTLILASMFPSVPADRISLLKLFAVLLNIVGIGMVSYSDSVLEVDFPLGAILALFGALFYAFYITYLRRNVEDEDKMDIPLFFGFVGLFNFIFLWPVFFILHFTGLEIFELPTKHQSLCLLLNGFLGTVVSEVIWLWGCFYTSSLIATMAISLTIPITMLADVFFKKVKYPSLFIAGTIPTFLSFFAVTVLSHFDNNWDQPVLNMLHCAYLSICRRTRFIRFRFSEMPSEQTESLIGINSSNEHEA